MSINEKLRGLEKIIGCPVRPDEYDGTSEKYITFTYEDERPTLVGDNETLADAIYLMVCYFTPSNYNYLEDKKTIKRALKEMGFNLESIQTWLENAGTGTKKIRRTVFHVNMVTTEES